MKRSAFAFAVVIATALTGGVFAKGETTQIRISSRNHLAGVVITNPKTLKKFNVWAGRGTQVNGIEQITGFIIDWASGIVVEKPDQLERYEASFYIGNNDLVYGVDYELDPATNRGYVYLPGKDDHRYRRNTLSIFRNLEGYWFHASHEWEEVVNARLVGISRQ
jgi:hypothetical protein